MHADVKYFNGNVDAFRFVEMMSYLANFWDDLVDCDKSMPEERIHQMMWLALIDLPRNRFYQQHYAALSGLMASGAMEYMVAREFERTRDPHGLELAHNLRYGIGQVATYVAMMCGASPALIAEMHQRCKPERIADYLKDFTHAQELAGQGPAA
ncbi:MAG: hypothetical protein IT493_11965 [Gammaproteobacteria bacterium]|nr:hypothetical protein [Gammaproteobacteria bacterium]